VPNAREFLGGGSCIRFCCEVCGVRAGLSVLFIFYQENGHLDVDSFVTLGSVNSVLFWPLRYVLQFGSFSNLIALSVFLIV